MAYYIYIAETSKSMIKQGEGGTKLNGTSWSLRRISYDLLKIICWSCGVPRGTVIVVQTEHSMTYTGNHCPPMRFRTTEEVSHIRPVDVDVESGHGKCEKHLYAFQVFEESQWIGIGPILEQMPFARKVLSSKIEPLL